MARRALKPLTPLLVALVALVLGFLAVGPSFADTAPSDGPIPASTPSVPVSDAPPAAVPSETPLPAETAPASTSAPKPPKAPKTVDPGPVACASCMAPPGA
jgi:hypothetical protein